jgi:hypothetical protein
MAQGSELLPEFRQRLDIGHARLPSNVIEPHRQLIPAVVP